MSSGGPVDFGQWFSAAQDENKVIERIASDPDNVKLVSERIKKSRGRTRDIALKCGDHLTGFSVALTCAEGKVHVVLLKQEALSGSPDRPAWKGSLSRPLDITCPAPGCGRKVRRKATWVIEKALDALARDERAIKLRP
jgi:hypothetical protein